MNKFILSLILFTSFLFGANECVVCHEGIEDIRDKESGMMKAIFKVADKAGHVGNDCIVCHGGNPKSKSKKYAHKGTVKYFKTNKGPKEFYPAPGSTWINENTCGVCHQAQVSAQMNSLMMTEQGKIQGALWSFGAKEGYEHTLGTYNSKNPDTPDKRLGTQVYKKYMAKLATMEPQAFPKEMHTLPEAPTVEEIHKDPSLAVYTYLRQECLRCHTGSKGRSARGDFRGIGCSSCHIPYSNEGFYEGNDKKISKKSGHLLTHQIQSSRKVKVQVNDINYSGVPVETCSTCHNRGKRIGVSYQGLMETEYQSTFDVDGNGQPKLHTKRYLHMKEDIHYKKGMLCQDCHTSNDLHGDGFLGGANLAAVEVECQDCHGTTKSYPWELPIGYSDEFNTTEAKGKPRGVASDLAEYLKQGYVPDKEDGYILTARGNPLPKAVKKGNKIIMHLASGKDIELKPLKFLKETEELSASGLLAMDTISAHTSKMECYSCHATWAPQCYGCHVKVDYSGGKKNPDYLKASHDQDIHGTTGGMRDLKKYLVDGAVTETRSYLRWEDPALAQNGEGRVSPVIPGCQTTITVIGKDGKALLQNHIFKIPNVEGAEDDGQNAIDMSPVQPHTIQKEARTCESCHSSDKALGLGIGGGKLSGDPSKTTIIDLMTPDGKIVPKKTDEQIPAIPNLKHDYSQFIDENGTQLMTVGHHFKLSQPLSEEQRDKLDRRGVCLSCHIDIPKGNLVISAMRHIAKMAEYKIDKAEHNSMLNKILNIGAFVQVIAVLIFILIVLFGIYITFFKKKPNNPRNEGWK
ncbi:multiheme c-type cytochrome [Candidatus Sulfurimonas baltica]|uniref:Cytochrome C n=1 Tax=Candidatus Sulfurimonas baltica TaxID=2740404 RepID=A0A7S7LVZ9_9BACT|nr:multiheme c-type cytochrome [Candidatus Sulfurimonas baltica]QOY51634.1 cytochrome C [Candidatus Sulfurimonas baltica]